MIDNISRELSKMLNSAVEEHKKSIEIKASREIELLKSLKNFMDKSYEQSIDNAIEMFYVLKTAESISNEMKAPPYEEPVEIMAMGNRNPRKSIDNSVHSDGIYDIDIACMEKRKSSLNNVSGIMMMLALMGYIK